jgi:tetratricopeptide (TPR) repeat protein
MFGFVLLFMGSCKESDTVKKERFLLKGNEKMRERDQRSAIKYYDEALRIDPEYADALNNRGVALAELGDYGRAGQDFQSAFLIDPNRVDILINKAFNALELKEYYTTLNDLEVVKGMVVDTPIVYFGQGLALWQLKRYDEAISSFDQAEKFDPYNFEIPINRASVRYFIGDYKGAKDDVNKGLILNPNEANAYNVLGLIAEKEGKLDSAFYWVSKALELRPNQPYFLNNRGYFKLKAGNIEAADEDINLSIRLDADNAWAYRNKGLIYMAQERYQEAIRNLKVASEMDPTVEAVFYQLGLAYERVGQTASACDAWSAGRRQGDLQSTAKWEAQCR